MAAPIYIPTKSVGGLPFLHTLSRGHGAPSLRRAAGHRLTAQHSLWNSSEGPTADPGTQATKTWMPFLLSPISRCHSLRLGCPLGPGCRLDTLPHRGSPAWLKGRQRKFLHTSWAARPRLCGQLYPLAWECLPQVSAGQPWPRNPAWGREPKPTAGRAWHARQDSLGSWPPLPRRPLLHRGQTCHLAAGPGAAGGLGPDLLPPLLEESRSFPPLCPGEGGLCSGSQGEAGPLAGGDPDPPWGQTRRLMVSGTMAVTAPSPQAGGGVLRGCMFVGVLGSCLI